MVSKKLIITEKPSVAKDLAAVLGEFEDNDEYFESDTYIITWALGHLLELFEPQNYDESWKAWLLKDLPLIPEKFMTRPIKGQKSRLAMIKKLGNRKDVVGLVNACDAGREGELIYRRIVEYCQLNEMPQERLWLRSMTSGAIVDAFSNLKDASGFENLWNAALCRGVADWLIGINGTRGLTRRLKSKREKGAYSVGRVQTPTLAMMVAREVEVLAHIPREYFEIDVEFMDGSASWVGKFYDKAHTASKTGDEASRPSRIFGQVLAEAIVDAIQKANSGTASETRKRSKQKPPLFFDLTSLQREANKRFKLSAKRTLQAAQRLYERHKLLTYPRTDSRYLPSDYGEKVMEVLNALSVDAEYQGVAAEVAKAPQNLDTLLNTDKVSDHFAIIPTGAEPTEALSSDDAKVYDLVVRQFLAAVMGPATWVNVERLVTVTSSNGPLTFRTTAKGLEIPGFLAAMGKEEAEPALPPLVTGEMSSEGVAVSVGDATQEEKETQPPSRYTEGGLLRMMETAGKQVEDDDLSEAIGDAGIGTPATRADTIERLVRQQYVRRTAGKLQATPKAIRLVDIITRINIDFLAKPELTGELQHLLKSVQTGLISSKEAISKFTDQTIGMVNEIVGFDYDDLHASEKPLGKCPDCGTPVTENLRGYSCANNTQKDAKCKFMIWKETWGRYVDRALVIRLLENVDKQIGPIKGFVDKGGRGFSVMLTLTKDPESDKWLVVIETTKSKDENEDEDPEKVIGTLIKCPNHDNCKIIETNHRYLCKKLLEGEIKKGGPLLAKMVCHREISVEEALAFFGQEGQTSILDGFISKRGNNFRATLKRKETGRVSFEFPPREPRATTMKKATKKKKTTKKKTATKKKTTTKKKATATKK